MSICLFLTLRFSTAPLSASDMARLDELLRTAPNLQKALVHSSSNASDPYVKDESPPQLVLQLYFGDVPDLEATLSRNGHIGVLSSRDEFPSIGTADISQQAMIVRPFAVPEPAFQNTHSTPYCTYLVSYEGEANDLNAWHNHYLDRHTKHMACFPGIRELEVYTRLDWISSVPWARLNFMQRNKVAFDSPEALTQALHSPVRHEMRADYKTFPSFTGPTTHYAMATRAVLPHALD